MPTRIHNEDSRLEERVAKLEAAVFGTRKKTATRLITEKASVIDYSNLTEVKRLKSFLDRSLCILNFLSEKNHSSRGLTPGEIVSILGETFGIQTSLQVISTQLMRASGKYIARQKIVGNPVRYCYRIIPEGKDYLRARLAKTKPAKDEED